MSYEYKIIPVAILREVATVPVEEGAYVTKSKQRETVEGLLADGFRWVRTEEGDAILEREIYEPNTEALSSERSGD